MDPQNRPDPSSNVPAVPTRGPEAGPPSSLPAVPTRDPEPEPGSDDRPDPDPWASGRRCGATGTTTAPAWLRRLRPRSVRLAVGLGLVGAALLLLPFLDDPGRWWIPVGLGFGTLVLLYLLRLDRVLFGWAPHVAGLVLVAALVWATSANPFAWGLAAGVGVVLAGLLLLPRWQVLAVGVALLVVAGVGYQFRSAELTEQQAQMDAQAGEQMRTVLGVERPQLALVSLDSGVADNNPRRVCRLVRDAALGQLLQATATASCEQAVAVLHGRAAAGSGRETRPDRSPDPTVAPGATTLVNGCSTTWGSATGPMLGRVELTRTDAPTPTYQVSAFRPC